MKKSHWAVATGHSVATKAAQRVLESGGNAIDAGVAAGIALGVVQPDLVSFAGVAPIILREAATGRVTSYDGVGVWPRGADVGCFEQQFNGTIPEGILRTVVPAAPASWIKALALHGTMRFGEVAADAIHAARYGFQVYSLLARFITEHLEQYKRFPSTAKIFLPGGRSPAIDDLFVQSDLANTLSYMVDEEAAAGGDRMKGLKAARDAFYLGDIARQILSFHKENGGLLSAVDLSDYQVREEETLQVRFRGIDVHCCGAWCQGISMAQALKMLEHSGNKGTPHFLVELLKRIFSDREAYVTDPKFMRVRPGALLDPAFITSRLSTIDPNYSDPMPLPGVLFGTDGPDHFPGGRAKEPEWKKGSADTSHVSVIDRDGNMFSATPSDTSCDTIVIEGTGLSLSSRGSQSRAIAGHPNALAPGKRPRLTPNPVLALKQGNPYLAFGTPGGDVQVQAMLQILINLLDKGMDLQAAINAPRFATYAFPGSFAPNEAFPNLVMVEENMDRTVIDSLRKRGHDVQFWEKHTWKAGGICAVLVNEDGSLTAEADPRRVGTSASGI